MNIGILASHNGTNLQAIIDAAEDGKISSKVSIVISNNSNSGAIERAKRHTIPFVHLSSKTHENPENLDKTIMETLAIHGCDLIFLAGYMKKLGKSTLEKYKGRILNTHPALLPKYGGKGMFGMNVHNAVITNRENESGISIHIVDENYDSGKVIAQTLVPVLSDDSPELLCERVMTRERQFVVETIKKIEEGEIDLLI
jgi:phosphoribosylglycinamide formyltransferase-1